MAEITEAEAVARLAEDGTEPHDLGDGLVGVRDSGGRLVITDLGEARGKPPRVKAAKVETHDATSFIGYVTKHSIPDTEVWANRERGTVTAILDAHGPAHAGHRRHTATLSCKATKDWAEWRARDRMMQPQVDFAEFLADHLTNVVEPPAADMLELAQTFQAKREVEYAPSTRLATGETALHYTERQTGAAGGKKGDITIPDTFRIGVQVYEGGASYSITAALRYRLRQGELLLGYYLERPDDVQRHAFEEATKTISDGIAPLVVWYGASG